MRRLRCCSSPRRSCASLRLDRPGVRGSLAKAHRGERKLLDVVGPAARRLDGASKRAEEGSCGDR